MKRPPTAPCGPLKIRVENHLLYYLHITQKNLENLEAKLELINEVSVGKQDRVNQFKLALSLEGKKNAQLRSDLGFLVSQRNIEVDDLNATITFLREIIKTVEALSDQLRPSAKSINMEIKDNFNPIQTNDNHVNVANQMSTQTSAHSFKDPSQVNRLTERLPDVGLYDNMTEQKGESKAKRKLIDGNKEWLGRLPLIETPTIRNLVK